MPEKPCGAIAELEPGPTLLRECRWPFTFQRTLDTDLIRSVITHPRIWPAISDDFSGKSEDFQPSTEPSTWYIAVREGETLLGLFILTRQTGVCAELHTCLLPIAWGRSTEIGRQLFDWVWENSVCERIVTNVPEFNRLALRASKRVGMTQFGFNERSFKKSGKLWGQILLGITRPQTR